MANSQLNQTQQAKAKSIFLSIRDKTGTSTFITLIQRTMGTLATAIRHKEVKRIQLGKEEVKLPHYPSHFTWWYPENEVTWTQRGSPPPQGTQSIFQGQGDTILLRSQRYQVFKKRKQELLLQHYLLENKIKPCTPQPVEWLRTKLYIIEESFLPHLPRQRNHV